MKFYIHQRIFSENLIKIGLILSAQWRFSEERYQACPVTLTQNLKQIFQVLICKLELFIHKSCLEQLKVSLLKLLKEMDALKYSGLNFNPGLNLN